MAMTVEEIRRSIATLCEDQEIFKAYQYLNGNLDWPVTETFNLLVLLDELKKRMKEDVTHFTFRKKDGTVREAYGTRASEVIVRHEGTETPSDGRKARQGSGTFPYYDIERQAWRCFRLDGLMDIERGYTI